MTLSTSEFQKLQATPSAFRDVLQISAAGACRPFSKVMADFQRKDFTALDVAFKSLIRGRKPEPKSRFWIERTKGGAKDHDIGLLVLWLVAFSPRSCPHMIQVAAAKQDQAAELRKAVRDMLRVNRWLNELVEVQTNAIVSRKTDTRCEIITADAAGSHGARPTLLIVNELTHIYDREFAETLLDNASKVPHGVVVIATNAGHVNTWQEEWRDNAIGSDRWYFSAFQQPAPWLDPAEMVEAKRRNSPGRYARLWEGQWGSSESGAIREEDLEAAMSLSAPPASAERGWSYVAGVDIGIKRDASALVVLGRHVGYTEQPKPEEKTELTDAQKIMIELGLMKAPLASPDAGTAMLHAGDGKLRLACVKVWKPTPGKTVDLADVETEIVRLHERFRLANVGFDTSQAEMLMQRLSAKGIRVEAVHPSTSNTREICTQTMEAFSEHRIELFDDPRLLSDLRKLMVEEKGYGMRLVSPRDESGHGDVASALGIALLTAKRRGFAEPRRINRPLFCWP